MVWTSTVVSGTPRRRKLKRECTVLAAGDFGHGRNRAVLSPAAWTLACALVTQVALGALRTGRLLRDTVNN